MSDLFKTLGKVLNPVDSMGIIEKLGITPIYYTDIDSVIWHKDTEWRVINIKSLVEVEQQRDDLLEALIDLTKNTVHGKNNPDGCVCGGCTGIRAIEKACYPMKWPEIKELPT